MSTEELQSSIDDEIIADVAEQERERRAGIGAWTTSVGIHGIVLVLLALVVVFRPVSEDLPPVRAAALAPHQMPPPPDRPTIEPEVTVEIETSVEVPNAASELPAFDMSVVDLVSEDLAAVSENVTARALAIGAGASGGGGGGSGAFMPGGGDGGSGTGFFGVGDGDGASANRIAYIIDMSKSLKEPQIALIKDRLLNSLADLSNRQRFEVLLYSGPVWQLGVNPQDARAGWSNQGWHNYTPPGALPQGEWRTYPPSVRAAVETYVMDELVTTSGTDWRHPFRIALAMDPLPDTIFFLTDGKVDNSEETIELIQSAVGEGDAPRINTIAFGLDDDDGVESLRTMSQMTDGDHIGYSMDDIHELYQLLLKEGKRK